MCFRISNPDQHKHSHCPATPRSSSSSATPIKLQFVKLEENTWIELLILLLILKKILRDLIVFLIFDNFHGILCFPKFSNKRRKLRRLETPASRYLSTASTFN